ncbi:MAG: hypothetical protein NT166_19180 [Candidatus Aminicenantes bacterium]|nr:hypothetical protein [Candidatus Aminicenantes bacterium]
MHGELKEVPIEYKWMQMWFEEVKEYTYDDMLFNHSQAAPVIFLLLLAMDLAG